MTARITMAELRDTGHCARGIRRWFNTHGLDFRAFMREGITADAMLATGCSVGIAAVNSVLGEPRDGEVQES